VRLGTVWPLLWMPRGTATKWADEPAQREAGAVKEALSRLVALADDVGRWNRFVACEDTYTAVLVERICHNIEAVDAALRPTAADLFRHRLCGGLSDDEALRDALGEVDWRRDSLRRRMGLDEDGHLPVAKRPPAKPERAA
jgi:hypothetical protein